MFFLTHINVFKSSLVRGKIQSMCVIKTFFSLSNHEGVFLWKPLFIYSSLLSQVRHSTLTNWLIFKCEQIWLLIGLFELDIALSKNFLCPFHKIFHLKSPKYHYDLIPPVTRFYVTRNNRNKFTLFWISAENDFICLFNHHMICQPLNDAIALWFLYCLTTSGKVTALGDFSPVTTITSNWPKIRV